MNETLYYEPAYEPVGDALVEEFDYQIPEYINPEWDDDELYNLICANQDVLVDVSGDTMTLSAAMNQHPGPWIPENEANLIAYAEGLLAGALIEPALPVEEVAEEAENEPVPEQQKAEAPPILKIEEQVKVEDKPATIEPQQAASPITPPEPTAPTFAKSFEKASSKIVNHPHEVEDKPKAVEHYKVPDVVTHTTEPNGHIDNAEQTLESVPSVEAKEPQIREDSQPEEPEPPEIKELAVAEVTDEVYIENDAAVNDIVPDIEYEQADETGANESAEQDVLANEHEEPLNAPEFSIDEVPPVPPPNYYADFEKTDQTNTIEYDQPELVVVTNDEVENALVQLAELIASDGGEGDEEINATMDKIFEAPTNLAVETKEEWAIFYVEIFEAAGIAYTPELIERLSVLTVERNPFDQVERLDDVGYVTPEGEDGSTRMMIKKLLVAIASIIQAIRHVFTIGAYVLRLSLAPRAGYQ